MFCSLRRVEWDLIFHLYRRIVGFLCKLHYRELSISLVVSALKKLNALLISNLKSIN